MQVICVKLVAEPGILLIRIVSALLVLSAKRLKLLDVKLGESNKPSVVSINCTEVLPEIFFIANLP